MRTDEIIAALRAAVDDWVQITYVDGQVETVKVLHVDDEGFSLETAAPSRSTQRVMPRSPLRIQEEGNTLYWARFTDVIDVEGKFGVT